MGQPASMGHTGVTNMDHLGVTPMDHLGATTMDLLGVASMDHHPPCSYRDLKVLKKVPFIAPDLDFIIILFK